MGHYLNNVTHAIAYWFRNSNKKDRYISKYCYDDFESHEELNTLILMLHILANKAVFNRKETEVIKKIKFVDLRNKIDLNKYDEVLPFLDTLRGFALPCPGCQKNYYNYLSGNYDSNWLKEDCIGWSKKHNDYECAVVR